MSVAIMLQNPPPSTNNLYRNASGRGRVKTDRYKTWLNAAGWDVKIASPTPISGPVAVDIRMERPRGRADIDNRCKALLDLLVLHRVIEDDALVQDLRIRWADDPGVLITIAAIGEGTSPAGSA